MYVIAFSNHYCRFPVIRNTIKELKKVLFSTQCIQNFGYEDKISDMSIFYSQVKISETIKCFEMTRSITQIEEMEMNGVYLIELDGKLKVMVPRTPKKPYRDWKCI